MNSIYFLIDFSEGETIKTKNDIDRPKTVFEVDIKFFEQYM